MLRRALIAVFAALATPAAAQDAPAVAAASDLSAVLPEVAAAFTKRTGRSVRLTFGSSGAFTQQILNGAPFQVFLSADEAYVERLQAAGKTVDGGVLYGTGRIGVFAPRGSPVRPDAALADLGRAARDGRLRKLAIANPEHAPYGRAAQAALEHAGLWALVKPRLVLGENVSQATQFATSGSAQAGIIPLSLAVTPPVKAAGTFVLIPAAAHPPLRQRAVLIKGAGPTARAFHAYLQGGEARAILGRYGFTAR